MDTLTAVLNCVYPFLIQTGDIEDKTQCWVQSQNKVIPKDKKLYLVAQMISAVPYANNVKRKELPGGDFVSDYQSATLDTVQLDLMSFGKETFQLVSKVLFSLRSVAAQNLMAKHGFRVMPLPTSTPDTSVKDGGDFINRTSITLQVFNQYGTILEESAYYDSFDDELFINNENNEV